MPFVKNLFSYREYERHCNLMDSKFTVMLLINSHLPIKYLLDAQQKEQNTTSIFLVLWITCLKYKCNRRKI